MEACFVIEPGKMLLVILLNILQVTHGFFGLSHIREWMFHSTILPFPRRMLEKISRVSADLQFKNRDNS